MSDMTSWRAEHDRMIDAINASNASTPSGTRPYAIAVRTAFRPVAASALTAIANAVGAPVAAPLVALWSAPLEGVAEYDASAPQSFGRTLSLMTPSDSKQETLAMRERAAEFDFAPLRNAIAFASIAHESIEQRSVLVLEPDSGAIVLVRPPSSGVEGVATPVASDLVEALRAALAVGYWAGDDEAKLPRYLEAIGAALATRVEGNRWLAALRAHRAALHASVTASRAPA